MAITAAIVVSVTAVAVMAAISPVPASPVTPTIRIGAGDGSNGQASDGKRSHGFSECIHQFHGRHGLRRNGLPLNIWWAVWLSRIAHWAKPTSRGLNGL
jgi:hypothetical protein